MKKIIFTLFAVAIATCAMAQSASVERRAQNRLASLEKATEITPEQATQMKALMVELETAKDEVAKLKGTPEYQVKVKAASQQYWSATRKVLSPEQIKEVQAYTQKQNALKAKK